MSEQPTPARQTEHRNSSRPLWRAFAAETGLGLLFLLWFGAQRGNELSSPTDNPFVDHVIAPLGLAGIIVTLCGVIGLIWAATTPRHGVHGAGRAVPLLLAAGLVVAAGGSYVAWQHDHPQASEVAAVKLLKLPPGSSQSRITTGASARTDRCS